MCPSHLGAADKDGELPSEVHPGQVEDGADEEVDDAPDRDAAVLKDRLQDLHMTPRARVFVGVCVCPSL